MVVIVFVTVFVTVFVIIALSAAIVGVVETVPAFLVAIAFHRAGGHPQPVLAGHSSGILAPLTALRGGDGRLLAEGSIPGGGLNLGA